MTSWRDINQGRSLDNMTPGFYKMSLAKGAPDVGAIIFLPCPMDPFYGFPMDRPRHLCAMINGREVDVWQIGTRAAERITQAEYEYLIADRAWAKQHAPDTPEANPYKAITTAPKSEAQQAARPTINIRDIPISSLMP